MNVLVGVGRARDLCGGSTVPGDNPSTITRLTEVRTGPQRLSLTHSSLVVDLTAGFLRVGAWPAPSTHTAGGARPFTVMYIPAHGCWFWGEGGSP